MENNILSLRKSRGNSKYKLKSAIELTHKIPKIRRKNRFLASSSLSWAYFKKPRTSCVRPKGLPWKLIGKQILSTKPKLRNSEKNLHHCKFIYLSVWNLSPTRVLLDPLPWSKRVICIGWQGFMSAICQRDILGEFQSKMIVFWVQYGVLLFPLNRP